jgi:hypothetical protein
MKKLVLFIAFGLLCSANVKAQKNEGDILKLSIGILNKIRLSYEHPVSNAFSYGGAAAYYYGSYPGIKVEPFAKYYLGGEAPSGLYLQGRFIYGSFNPSLLYYDNFDVITVKKNVSSVGGGIDLGYQWLSGRDKNIAIDFSLGAQFMNDINGTVIQNNREYESANVGFLTTGPGAIFNPKLSIGYRF